MNSNIKIKQQDITDCGAASLASICAYYGLRFPVARIRQYAYTDKKGTIDTKELKQSLESLDVENERLKKRMIRSSDKCIANGKNIINFDDFVEIFGTDDSDSDEGIRDLFDSMADEKNPNIISFESMKKLVKELGENMSDQEIKDMIIYASKNHKEELTFEEFYEIMKKRYLS